MISSALYQQIMCDLEKLDLRLVDADAELVGMENNLSLTTVQIGSTTSLLNEIQNVRAIIITRRTSIASQIANVVIAVHSLIVQSNGSVDSFLSNNSIKIPQFIANISNSAGYTVSIQNIKHSCQISSSSSG